MLHQVSKPAFLSGFTLIELSIVLVIIGLITGGILTGQGVIHTASIRATIGQLEKYNTAVNTFRNKYNALPGDILGTQAAMFGLYEAETNQPNYQSEGDGDGLIEPYTGIWLRSAGYEGEVAMFFLHLSQAGLIEGSYGFGGADVTLTGATATGGSTANAAIPTITATATMIQELLPPAKFGNGNYFIVGNANGKNYFIISGIYELDRTGNVYSTNNLTPLEAYAIDKKIDDGLPGSGRVFALDTIPGHQVLSYSNGAGLTTPAANNCVNGSAYYISNSAYANLQNCSVRFDFQE